nr:GTP binding domain-containing protein [Tanacetum cinerariifolium]
MFQDTKSKFGNFKKRAKFALGKSKPVNSSNREESKTKTLGFKDTSQTRKVNADEEPYKRRNDSVKYRNDDSGGGGYRGKRNEGGDNRGGGFKSGYKGRKDSSGFGGSGLDGKRKRVYGGKDDYAENKYGNNGKGFSRGRRGEGNAEFGEGKRTERRDYEKSSGGSTFKNRVFDQRDSRHGGGDRRRNFENGERRVFGKRDSHDGGGGRRNSENGENRMFNKRESTVGGGDRRRNGETRMFDKESRDRGGDRINSENGETRVFGKREPRDGGGDRRNSTGENRMFSKREPRDGGGDRRFNAEKGDNRNGLSRKNGETKYENNKQLQSPVEDHEIEKKRLKNMKNYEVPTTFDRPKRKMRLFRVEYPNDPAKKRFDDSPPTPTTAVNDTEQKEGSDSEDAEENAEMSKNAQFRAIQPSQSLTLFVNENLLGRRRELEFRKAGYNIELPSPLDDVPFSTSSERGRIEESAFRNKLEFFAAAKVSSSFPDPDLPEIAFAGRSNVGKSSLLNSLTRQWGVVRTSDKPGLTQTINFFNLGSKLCLVDLPGYGFAYAKDEVKESWEELVKEYVSTREGLKRVCLLIDTKWGMKARDYELIDLMERSKTKYQIVLTKTDLAFPIDVARRAMQIEETLKTKKSAVQPLMMVSSKTGAGIRSLRTVLSNISRFARL